MQKKKIGKIIVRYILILVGTTACYGLDGPGLESRWGQWKNVFSLFRGR